jgi:hypothetical protein
MATDHVESLTEVTGPDEPVIKKARTANDIDDKDHKRLPEQSSNWARWPNFSGDGGSWAPFGIRIEKCDTCTFVRRKF